MGNEHADRDVVISGKGSYDITQLDPSQYNILIPSLSMGKNLPPGVSLRLVYIRLNPSPEMRDVWKLPTKERRTVTGDGGLPIERWVEVFEPTSKALDRLRWAVGADVDCVRVDDQSNPQIKSFRARISLRRADGTLQTATGEYELEISARVEEFRAKLSDQFEDQGYIIKSVWEQNSKGKPEKKDVKLEGENGLRYIERQTRDYRIHLQKHGARLADTRARAAAMRSFVALKGAYTAEELSHPFVMAYYEFAPEFNPSALLQMYGITRDDKPKMADVAEISDATATAPALVEKTLQAAMPTEAEFNAASALLASATPPTPVPSVQSQAVQDVTDLFRAPKPESTDKPTVQERYGMLTDLSDTELRELIVDIVTAKGWKAPGTQNLTRQQLVGYIKNLMPKKAGG